MRLGRPLGDPCRLTRRLGGGCGTRATVVECSGLAYRSSANSLGDKPSTEDREDVPLSLGMSGHTLWGYPVPFLKAATAAGCSPVLSDEDRVGPIGVCLPSFGGVSGVGCSSTTPPATSQFPAPWRLRYSLSTARRWNRRRKGGRSQSLKNMIQIAVHRRSPLRQAFVIELAHVNSQVLRWTPPRYFRLQGLGEPAPREVRHKEPSRVRPRRTQLPRSSSNCP